MTDYYGGMPLDPGSAGRALDRLDKQERQPKDPMSHSTDKELLKILVDYFDDLATLKMREGRLPAQAAIHRILALQNNAVVAELETLLAASQEIDVTDLEMREYQTGDGSIEVVRKSIIEAELSALTKKGHSNGKDN